VNEDERGITPADVTAITLDVVEGRSWHVTIEQGNGDVLKDIELTWVEGLQLAAMIDSRVTSVSFVDVIRAAVGG